ncbi:PREDICTED: odorant receptor 82a-like isoform X1 [Vollenhovia emeryi]|uniref:odorant receptor 82a-like isoform X1 n=1 Tax=Vollenhovia emeryi TaxID=411798 RepID=UPI0005F44B11|nr:PREDICTED: odorant receptor 82a-like isoform X1 [Vollenhovia emeryi]
MTRTNTINRTVEIGLRFIGMWPGSAYPNLYWFSYMTTVVIVQYYQYAYIFAHFDLNDLWLLMDCLSLTLAYSLAFLKLLVLWWNRRIFYYIVKAIDQDWSECVNNVSYRSTMTSMADTSSRFANVMLSLYASSAFFLSIGEHLIQSMDDVDQFGNSSRELPIKMEFPFDVSESPIFECFLIGQFLYDMVIAFVVGLTNPLLVTLILHVNGQIDIMQQDLIEISKIFGKYNRNAFLLVIRGLICKHQKIITLSENIENLYTNLALMQLLWNTLVMCCTGFVIIIIINSGEDTSNLVKSVIYYIAIISEVFIYCFAGEFLSAKILHVAGQIDIMRQAILDVHSDGLGVSSTVINDLIQRHRRIITLSDDIENLFSSISLMQLLWNTLTICFTGFMIMLALSSKKGIIILAKAFILYFVKTVEVFVFCYAGEFLSAKSKSISDAVYESLWYNMVPADSRILLFIMMRSQKRLTITAGKLFDLTLEGFMSVMKASASYMSVLHAMN